MVNSEELIGTTGYLTLQARFRINLCRYNRARLYSRKDMYIYDYRLCHVYRGYRVLPWLLRLPFLPRLLRLNSIFTLTGSLRMFLWLL
jgi:hypothetical protein